MWYPEMESYKDSQALVADGVVEVESNGQKRTLVFPRGVVMSISLVSLVLIAWLLYATMFVPGRIKDTTITHFFHGNEFNAQENRVRTLLSNHINQKALKQEVCAIDVQDVVTRLMDGSVNVANADVQECHRVETQLEQEKCGAIIMNAIWQYTSASAAIAKSVSDCAKHINVRAKCAGIIQSFLADLEIIGGCALWADLACNGNFLHPYVNVIPDSRRLSMNSTQSLHAQWPAPIPKHDELLKAKRQFDRAVSSLGVYERMSDPRPSVGLRAFQPRAAQDARELTDHGHGEPGASHGEHTEHHEAHGRTIMECIVQVSRAAVFLEKVAVSITHSVMNCVPSEAREREGQTICSVGVLDLLGELAVVAALLSAASNSCGEVIGKANEPGVCGYGSAGVIAGVFETTAAGMELQESCEEEEEEQDATYGKNQAPQDGDINSTFPTADELSPLKMMTSVHP